MSSNEINKAHGIIALVTEYQLKCVYENQSKLGDLKSEINFTSRVFFDKVMRLLITYLEVWIKWLPPKEDRMLCFWKYCNGHKIRVNYTMNEGVYKAKKC